MSQRASAGAAPAPRVLLLGAASGIAEAVARRYAAEGAHLLLAGRDAARLESIAADLRVRGAASAEPWVRDLAAPGDEAAELAAAAARLGGLDHVLLAYGVLGEQPRLEQDADALSTLAATNFVSAARWCQAAAALLERQGRGSLVVIGSVAGDRGRRSNYAYGATKAGLAVLVQGIAHRFAARSPALRAVIVKPGFVRTPMTAGLRRDGLLWADPDRVARVIRAAADRGGPVVYAPGFWRWIMLVIRLLPAPIFNRLSI